MTATTNAGAEWLQAEFNRLDAESARTTPTDDTDAPDADAIQAFLTGNH